MAALFPLLLLVASGVVYHLAQKSAGTAASPWPLLTVAYGAAFALALAVTIATGDGAPRLPTRGERVAALLIGAGAMGIEVGFFLGYRAGWPLASTSVLVGLATATILATVGVLAYGEHLSATRAAGIVIAALGGWLITRR